MAKATDLQERSFLGRGWDFPPTFSKSNLEVRMTADEDDIQKSLEILLSTTIGERFLQPNYGCNLENFVFEPMNATIQTLIKLTVKDAIQLLEPRIRLLSVELDTFFYVEEGRVDIHVNYEIKGTNSRFNLVYPFYINEASSMRP